MYIYIFFFTQEIVTGLVSAEAQGFVAKRQGLRSLVLRAVPSASWGRLGCRSLMCSRAPVSARERKQSRFPRAVLMYLYYTYRE